MKGQEGLSSSPWFVEPRHAEYAYAYHCYRNGDMVGFAFKVIRALTPQKWHAYVYLNGGTDRIQEEFVDLRKAIEWVESVSMAVKAME